MKTRLLLFLLLTFSYSNAQFNVSEGFESGFPAGWTTTGINQIPEATPVACSGAYNMSTFLSSSNPFAVIYTSSYVSSGNSIDTSFKFKRDVLSFSGNVYFYYELNNSGTWTLMSQTNSIQTTCQILSGTIPAGVVPAGNSVKFRMQINRSSGDNYLYFDDFTANQNATTPPNSAIAEYNFNNNYNNVLGSNPFIANTGTQFVTDRHGNSASALSISNTGTTAIIPNLPYGSSSRTVSVWTRVNSFSAQPYNFLFSYGGNGTTGKSFCGSVTATNAAALGYNENFNVFPSNTTGTWYHYVFVYNGTTVKIYRNGILLGSGTYTWSTFNYNSLFKLGTGVSGELYFSGAVDDLKIYNYVLTDAEVTNLYTNNSLTSENFNANNLEVGLYPNPVNDILNIDTKEEVLSVEVFALQGQKVMSSKQNKINVAELPAGIYLVRIEDVNNNIATKKIIKN
jgi:hypothetical protein